MEGIHIHAVMFTAPDDETVGMLQIRIMPLPAEIVQPLADHIRNAALAWLTAKQITSGAITEIPLVPPGSLPN